jgi:hypothetical protein
MADFSSFFPAAGGGGGFTKINKYSTSRAIGGAAVIRQSPPVPLTVQANRPGNSSFVTVKYTDSSFDANFSAANAFVGYFFYWSDPNQGGVTTNVITSSTANTGANSTFTINFSPNAVQSMTVNNTINTIPSPITVNPATDLGLEDGASIGYFIVGSGARGGSYNSNAGSGGNGGYINQGTAIITNASTDLTITPATASTSVGSLVHSTISGGLTLTSADGTNLSGDSADLVSNASGASSGGTGIMGYGTGGPNGRGMGGIDGGGFHGFGGGGNNGGTTGGDGAILLFY